MPDPLSQFNKKISALPFTRFIGLLFFFLSLFAYLGHYSHQYGLNIPPSTSGDETAYDSIGWELSQGRGYATNQNDPEFRQPYIRAAREVEVNSERFLLGHSDGGTNVVRPPLFPILISVTNLSFGRQHWAIRTMNAIAIAATCGLVVQFIFCNAGVIPAILGSLLYVVVDVRSRLYGRAILTEAFSVFFITLLVLSIIKLKQTQQLRWTFAAGVVMGLSILTRSIFVLWIPGITLLILCCLKDIPWQKKLVYHSALFVGVLIVIVMPWGIRNCQVLRSFKPMGTQGLTQLSAGFSDVAVQNRGVWKRYPKDFFNGILQPEMSLPEAELVKAEFSRKKAIEWIKEHPLQTVWLAVMKNYQEFRPHNVSDAIVLPLALLGMILAWKTEFRFIFIGMIATNIFAIGATWSVEGRFLVPMLFIFHTLAAIGLWEILRRGASWIALVVPSSSQPAG